MATKGRELEVQRALASAASGGVSGDPIYSIFVQAVEDLQVTGALLDFGAGKGNLVQRLQALGRFISVTAIDVMPRPPGLSASIQWVGADLNEPTEFLDRSFDVIVAAEVIEHLENPRATVREWFRLLRSGGTVLFSTPNNESWRSIIALVLRGHFAYFGDQSYPAHITALLRKDIGRILDETGFLAPTFVYTNIGIIPKTRLSWQAISKRLFSGLRYSDNIIAITRKP